MNESWGVDEARGEKKRTKVTSGGLHNMEDVFPETCRRSQDRHQMIQTTQ